MKNDYCYVGVPISVTNMNALSGDLTYGLFPMTSLTGFQDALRRQLPALEGITYGGIGIAVESVSVAKSRIKYGNYTPCISKASRTEKTTKSNADKIFNTPVELLTRQNMKATFIFRFERAGIVPTQEEMENFIHEMSVKISFMGFGGGKIFLDNSPFIQYISEEEASDIVSFTSRLKGFLLVEAHEEFVKAKAELQLKELDCDDLDVLIYAMMHIPHIEQVIDNEGKKANLLSWSHPKRSTIISVAGFAEILAGTKAGAIAGVRDDNVPASFVESCYQLSKFVFARSIEDFSTALYKNVVQMGSSGRKYYLARSLNNNFNN